MAQIRVATAADADAIARIYAPIVESTIISFEEAAPSADEMARRIETTLARFPWLVAEEDGIVLGYAYASAHRERAAYRWSCDSTVYVAECARGKGVGRALYARLFEMLRERGYYNVFAGVGLPNGASVGLHRAMGFELVGVYKSVGFKLNRWVDTAWFQLQLREPVGTPTEPGR